MLEELFQSVPVFALAFFRLCAMMLSAPLFGSARVPRRVKVLFALVLVLGLMPLLPASVSLPESLWGLSAAIGGEIVFGFAMGTALSFTFVAVHWAGEIIGQQMGINLGEVFDPQFGQHGSVVGDLYFLLTLVIFLIVRGHHAILRGVRASFDALPLGSVGSGTDVLDLLVGLVTGSLMLAIQLAAPVLVTMLVVDLVLGFIGKTVPQINVMSAGLSLRAGIGILVLVFVVSISSQVIRDSMLESMRQIELFWRGRMSGT